MSRRRKPCRRCGARPYDATWTLRPCALGRKVKILLCARCDVHLNGFILRLIRHPKTKVVMAKYRKRMLG
jgi:hypothetical protein